MARNCLIREGEQTARANQLFEAYKIFAKQCMGPKNTILVSALKKIFGVDPEQLISSPDTRSELSRIFFEKYPERCALIGEGAVVKTINGAIESAKLIGANSRRSMAISTGFSVFAGKGYLDDPVYPWVQKTLESNEHDADKKFENLFEKSRAYLQSVIQFWEDQ